MLQKAKSVSTSAGEAARRFSATSWAAFSLREPPAKRKSPAVMEAGVTASSVSSSW